MLPIYNEQRTLETILDHVLVRPEVAEVIAVDDGSTDRSWEILQRLAAGDRRIRVYRQPQNRGKGEAIRLAVSQLTAPYAIVQDSDLEYDPEDYPDLLSPLMSGRADAVNGVRGFRGHTAYSYWFVQGNRMLTTALNMLFDCYVSDLLSGYKVLRTDLWRQLNLQSRGFELETEIVAKVVRLGYRFHEIPITYVTRSRAEGKKIRMRDGFRILRAMLRVRFLPLPALFGKDADFEYHRRRQDALANQHPLVTRHVARRVGRRPAR
jgi:glycosyltransferase involved in cell wall biosynthesis